MITRVRALDLQCIGSLSVVAVLGNLLGDVLAGAI
jgi:hypothetical protein